MKRLVLIIPAVILAVVLFLAIRGSKTNHYTSDARTLARGRTLFSRNCSACHGLQEDGIGPKLGGITRLLSEEQLASFIRNPGKEIESRNVRAVAMQARYKLIMPAFEGMADDSLHAILSYLDEQTERFSIEPLSMDSTAIRKNGLKGSLVAAPVKSMLKIELQDVIQIPRMPYSTPDIGSVPFAKARRSINVGGFETSPLDGSPHGQDACYRCGCSRA